MSHKHNLVNFFFEIGFLKKIKRSARKDNSTSVAEHSFRVTLIAYCLAKEVKADLSKVSLMALIHDLPETRIGDLDVLQRKFLKFDEVKIMKDMMTSTDLNELVQLYYEYNKQKSIEAKLVHDADVLEELMTEKEQFDKGDIRAKGWMKFSNKRLLTNIGKEIGECVMKGYSDSWWESLIGDKLK
jgi:putative hydrolase of HD superfamily